MSTSLPQAPTAAFAIAIVLVVAVFAGAVIKVVVTIAATGAVGLVWADVIVFAPIHHAVSTAIEFPSKGTLGDALAIAQGVSAVALAIINCVVAFPVWLALRVGRTNEIGGTPVVDAVATAIELLSIRAHRDTLSIVELGSSLARFAFVVREQDLIGRATAITLAGRAGLGRNQITGAHKAGNFASDGQVRANVRAQISDTRSRGTGSLDGNGQLITGSSQLGAASSRSST